jgi:hypothetical protein
VTEGVRSTVKIALQVSPAGRENASDEATAMTCTRSSPGANAMERAPAAAGDGSSARETVNVTS